jgi:hypothetical protein
MEQMLLWETGWTDDDFEMSIVTVQNRIEKLNRSFFAVYSKHKESLEELDGIVQELISYRVDRSQAMGEL